MIRGIVTKWLRQLRIHSFWVRYGKATSAVSEPRQSHGLRILFWPFRARSYPLSIEMTLARAMQLRGHQVGVFFCNRVFDSCENFNIGDDENDTCRLCCYEASSATQLGHVPTFTAAGLITRARALELDEIARTTPLEKIFIHQFKGIELGSICESSVLRYTLKAAVDLSKDEKVVRRYFRAALHICEAADQILDQFNPDRLVVSHGIYNSWGIVTQLAKARNIPVSSWTFGYRWDSILVSRNDSHHRTLQQESFEPWANRALTPAEENRLDQYVASKWRGSFTYDFVRYYPNNSEKEHSRNLYTDLGLDPKKHTAGLFPNIPWDAAVVFGEDVFAGMVDWLLQTVKYFSRRPHLQLIIRAHPAEVRGARVARQKAGDIIHERFGELPDNIKFIAPENETSSYSVGEIIDVALVYGTKLGLEMALRAIPVIVAGRAYYKNKGFTYDPNSQKHYFQLLNNLHTISPLTPAQLIMTKRYAFHYYFRRHQVFDLIQYKEGIATNVSSTVSKWLLNPRKQWKRLTQSSTTLGFNSVEELHPGQNDVLDFVCARIVDKGDFIMEPE